MSEAIENKLLGVAEGIMDTAAEEYRKENLSSVEAVQRYADAINVKLTKSEAQLVLDTCRKMQDRLDSGEIPSTNDWFHDFETVLSGQQETRS